VPFPPDGIGLYRKDSAVSHLPLSRPEDDRPLNAEWITEADHNWRGVQLEHSYLG
jgi:hypothetical protein